MKNLYLKMIKEHGTSQNVGVTADEITSRRPNCDSQFNKPSWLPKCTPKIWLFSSE